VSLQRTTFPRRRLAALTVTLVALLLRALVPAGFMLATDARAEGVVITICTGNGMQSHAVLRADGTMQSVADPAVQGDGPDTGTGEAQGHQHAPCVFAALAQLPAGTDAPALVNPLAQADTAVPPQTFSPVAPGRGLAAPPPPATAPPLQL
jgi:hypothetical protein